MTNLPIKMLNIHFSRSGFIICFCTVNKTVDKPGFIFKTSMLNDVVIYFSII